MHYGIHWVHSRVQRFSEPVFGWPSVKYVSIVSVNCINSCLNKDKATGFGQHLPFSRSITKLTQALGGNEVCAGKHSRPSWSRTWKLFSLVFNSWFTPLKEHKHNNSKKTLSHFYHKICIKRSKLSFLVQTKINSDSAGDCPVLDHINDQCFEPLWVIILLGLRLLITGSDGKWKIVRSDLVQRCL